MPKFEFSGAELDRLADLLAERVAARLPEQRRIPPAYTPQTLAAELGRSERSIRAAIARGELAAVKRGRGYVISVEAVAEWAHAELPAPTNSRGPRRGRRGDGLSLEAARRAMGD